MEGVGKRPSGRVEMQGLTISDEKHQMEKYKSKVVNAIEPKVRHYTGTREKWKQVGKTSKKNLRQESVGGRS